MQATSELAKKVGVQAACSALTVSRATFYRHRKASPRPARERPRPPLALSAPERQKVVDVLHSPRFVDSSPREVWATLLDDDQQYLCSPRTMYRAFRGVHKSGESPTQRPY